jgi:hypothetical protein
MANIFRAAAAALLPCLLIVTTLSAAGLPNARLLVLSPPGGQQGTDLEVGIEGDDLDEATHLIFSHPGITATAKLAPRPFDKTPEIEYGNKVHEAMEYRIGGKPLPAHMMHWEPIVSAYVDRKAKPEKKTGITKDCKPTGFFDKDVWLRCKIDVTMLNGTAVFLSDFKTGNSKYEDPFELECQAVMLHAMNPYLTKIAGNFVWLKENRIGQVHDLSDTRSAWAKINNKVEAIEDAMKDGDWPKNKTPLCGWCGSVPDVHCRYGASVYTTRRAPLNPSEG